MRVLEDLKPWPRGVRLCSLESVSPRVLQIAILFIEAAWRRRAKYWGYLLQDRPEFDVRRFLRVELFVRT